MTQHQKNKIKKIKKIKSLGYCSGEEGERK
jgi:hypothetical protein